MQVTRNKYIIELEETEYDNYTRVDRQYVQSVCLHYKVYLDCFVAMGYLPENLFDQPKPLWFTHFSSNEDIKVLY